MSSVESEIYARLSGGLVTTPFYIELLDAAGKKAVGYLAVVGAGETLGSELLLNLGFDTDTSNWTPTSATLASIAGGQDGNCLEITTPAPDFGRAYQNPTGIQYALFKSSAYHKSGTSGNETHLILEANSGIIIASGISSTIWQLLSGYYTDIYGGVGFRLDIRKDVGIAGTMLFDTASVKRVTDPPSTAVHIVSSLNGTTRNWASIESGFDPNTITSWKIYDLATPGFYLPGVGTFNRGDFTVGNAFFWSSIDLSPYAGKLITAATGLTALVGSKIYPLTIPQHIELPAVTYMKVSDVPEHAMGGDSPIKTIRVQVDCWAETFDSMTAIEAQVIACLSRYRGGNILDCFLDSSMHFFDNDTFHSAIDFQVFFYEA